MTGADMGARRRGHRRNAPRAAKGSEHVEASASPCRRRSRSVSLARLDACTRRAAASMSPPALPVILPPDTEPREFAFTPRDFQRVRASIYARAGISLDPGKQNMVYSRVSRRLRALGMTSFSEYLDSSKGWRRVPGVGGVHQRAHDQSHRRSSARLTTSRSCAEHLQSVDGCAADGDLVLCGVHGRGALFDRDHGVRSVRHVAPSGADHRERHRHSRARDGGARRVRRWTVSKRSMRSDCGASSCGARGANAGMARVRPEVRALVEFARSTCSTTIGRCRASSRRFFAATF